MTQVRRAAARAADLTVLVGGGLVGAGILEAGGPNWATVMWGFAIAGLSAGAGSWLRREGQEPPPPPPPRVEWRDLYLESGPWYTFQ